MRPSWNICPGQWAPVVAHVEGRRMLIPMEWGLIPSWMDSERARPFINIRAETAAEKPAFRAAYRRRRLAVPLDGWYEWQGEKGSRQPWYFHGEGPLFMAGLWEEVEGRQTFAVITRPAAGGLAEIHDRMPALLRGDALRLWLDPVRQAPSGLLLSGTDDGLSWHKVGRRVGSSAEQGPGLIEPL